MNQEIKTEWVRRLRSGQYLQGTGRLRTNNGETRYCCLGVLCEMAVEAGIVRYYSGGYTSVADPDDQLDTLLIFAVRQWAGLADDAVKITVTEGAECPNRWDLEPGEPCEQPWCHVCGDVTLVDLNDEKQATFEEIADVIEEWL